jgi:hypothetical protein
MTTVWGPLGWMTLHSVATCYPETPTQMERELMHSWLDMFRDTITCPHCRDHFAGVLQTYRATFPGMLNSRQEFSLFSFRVHNAVNRRLKKPLQMTLEACIETLQNNVKTRRAQDYRVSYLNHIARYWRTYQDITGIVALKKVNEMRKIEVEYVQNRDSNFVVTLTPDVVVLPRDALERSADGEDVARRQHVLPRGPGARAGFRITANGIRLR